MAGGIASKGSALVNAARVAITNAQQAIDVAMQKGQVDTTSAAAALEVAAVVDPAIAAAITALTAIT